MSVWRLKAGVNIQEVLGSPKYSFADRSTCTRIFQGRFTTIMNNLPKRGSTMTGINPSFTISSIEVENGGGGKGTMTVLLEGPPSPSEQTTSQPTYEIEWTEVEKALETHPRYAEVSQHYRSLVAAYFATSDMAEREDIKAQIPSEHLAYELLEKKQEARESYRLYIPIARRTTNTTLPVLNGVCGHVGAPTDFTTLPAGYIWIQSAARSLRTGTKGKWQTIEEWTGLDDYDQDIYPD
ncbi:MAG: hypothetical protein ACOYOU_00840 [Kiritimatiellia bacterium]